MTYQEPPEKREFYAWLALRWTQLSNGYSKEQIAAWGLVVNELTAGHIDYDAAKASHILIFDNP